MQKMQVPAQHNVSHFHNKLKIKTDRQTPVGVGVVCVQGEGGEIGKGVGAYLLAASMSCSIASSQEPCSTISTAE